MARSANERLRDAALRRAIGVRRYSAGLARRATRILEAGDSELVKLLRRRLGLVRSPTDERWTDLLNDIRATRDPVFREYRETVRSELRELASVEALREAQLLELVVPFDVAFNRVPPEALRAILTARPFQGKFLREWWKELRLDDQRRLRTALQTGLTIGRSVDEMVRTVVGTRGAGYADGATAVTRREASAILRTAVNHVSNSAREAVWAENEVAIAAQVYTATLDGRTSAVCRANDGKIRTKPGAPVPEGFERVKPSNIALPAHLNCRSVYVAYLDGLGLVGDRPFVRDSRTRRERETDFRKIARETGRSVREVRAQWTAENIGRVPAATSYSEFLKRQPTGFQNEVLGVRKARLFRAGKLELNQFIDRRGNELTLAELEAKYPDAFE